MLVDVDEFMSRCCRANVAFYDWYICSECGETIHDPETDADPRTTIQPESKLGGRNA